ncbi:MAG TPA: ribonuclease HII [Deltaproteobacteria bacterium]|nr:ribonuclease HII [Deltaproteobacteria bacterium]
MAGEKASAPGPTAELEAQARKMGVEAVAGVDEAGRGPLAGPVAAAAVVFAGAPPEIGIDDSKRLAPRLRTRLAAEIFRTARAVGLGLAWPAEIDGLNIHRATLLAMERAVARLAPVRPRLLLIDGIHTTALGVEQRTVKGGDARCLSIAAASIVAKTARDRIMEAYERIYPGYGFGSNKGYGTARHIDALRALGPTPIHRRTFLGRILDVRNLSGISR